MSSMADSDSRTEREFTCSPSMARIICWERRCLFVVLIVLVSMMTVNLTLVFWISKVLSVDSHGMNYLQSFGGGVQFTAKSYVRDLLITSGLKTREGQPMTVRSVKNLTLRTTDRLGFSTSTIELGGSVLDINSHNFTVSDPRGKTLFNVNPDSVSLFTHLLAISGEGGAVLKGDLLTPVVSADVRSNLVLESVMKSVEVGTPAGISIESRAGDIQVSSNLDINLQTDEGSIKLESSNVLFPGLHRHHHKHSYRSDKIYQLCVCENGQLFLGEADAFCNTEEANIEFC
ncbi:gamma-sarcoglycan-like isoform X1 [Macrosteles quadrilineatus]|uniref:gamma-sarcoglycan-like isoform X1 n=2 Tax=Macrosteles quadrilineatus TaxID=74068 RepID=UPI0023E30932|nr:gamma-sarcoglycan-like isoform X1 [Macrosteles quadrilineatus]